MSNLHSIHLIPSSAAPFQVDKHPALVYLASLTSPASRRTMTDALNTLARVMGVEPVYIDVERPRAKQQEVTYLAVDWSALRYTHTAALRAKLAQDFSPARANTLLSALRGVLREAWRLEQLTAEDYQRAIDIQNIKAETLPRGRDLSDGEILALVHVCRHDPTPVGQRDTAILAVLATCGVRRAELVALRMDDFDADSGRIVVRSGKGRKERTVYAANGAKWALLDWLAVRGLTAGALFCPILKGSRIQVGAPMTAQAVYKMLFKRGLEAGLEAFTPHDFRRTFAADLLDRGVDLSTVSKLMGHADPKTTARYDRRDEQTKQDAAAKLHFPYQRRRSG